MDNQEPPYQGLCFQDPPDAGSKQRDHNVDNKNNAEQELYPFKAGVVSQLRDLDTFQTTYSFNHKPFNRNEQICGPYWTR